MNLRVTFNTEPGYFPMLAYLNYVQHKGAIHNLMPPGTKYREGACTVLIKEGTGYYVYPAMMTWLSFDLRQGRQVMLPYDVTIY